MKSFEEFAIGKNRTIHPPTNKFPNGYLSVMIYEEDYKNLLKLGLEKSASIVQDTLWGYDGDCGVEKKILAVCEEIDKL